MYEFGSIRVEKRVSVRGKHDDYRTLLTAIENSVNNNFAMTYALAR